MMAASTAEPYVPAVTDLPSLAEAARGCRGCELFENATQTVFGAGSAGARAMFVGEQPGDLEDRAGAPFVGPAGQLLDRALTEAGIDRSAAYVTNAVKHFRFKSTAGGQRRIHEKPAARHVSACEPWLTAELTAVQPEIVVALGATAAQALFGSAFRVTKQRGELLDWPPAAGPYSASAVPVTAAIATIHPSAVLRSRTAEERDTAFAGLVLDLRVVAAALR
ncbi:UdgX family uracil-DNA binding protein [Nakamurella sp. GG22]